MTWWAIVPPLVAGIVIVLLPGLVIAYAARARGITAWGLAPGLSMTVFTVIGLIYGIPHLPWNAGTVAIGTLVVVLIVATSALLLTRRSPQRFHDPRALGWWALAASAIAFVLIGIRFAVAFGHPDAISQTFDANFHLNGVRYILSTGDADPLTFSDLQYAYNGLGSFYPNLWHMVASLIAQLSGASIPVAVNAFSIVIGAVIWPLSCLLLIRQLLGARGVGLIAAAVLSASFAAFPILFVTFGVLYPNVLGMALVPAGLGILVIACGRATDAGLGRAQAWMAFVALLPGIALAHPNALVSLLGIGAPVLGAGWLYWLKMARRNSAGSRTFVRAILTAVIVTIAYAAVFIMVRPPRAAATWDPTLGPWRGLFNAAVNAQLGTVSVIVSILAVIGAVSTFVKRRHRWLVLSALLVDVLYVAVAYLPVGDVRYWVTGIWYSDVYRVIAMTPIVLTPLTVMGVLWTGELLVALVRRTSPVGRSRPDSESVTAARPVALATLALILVLGSVAQVEPVMTNVSRWTAATYRLDANSVLLDSDEMALIDRAARDTPKDAVIVGDPWTGTELIWALANRRALVPHIYVSHTPETALILQSLRTAKPGSKVCDAVRKEHVTYALDFGDVGVFGKTGQYPGVHHLNSSHAMQLVDSVGKARLYRITACA